MRQIKFRGKSIYNNEWVSGNLRIFGERAYISAIDSHAHSEVYLATVGQFTGLRDSKGREIYEGDIINWLSIRNGGQGFIEEGFVEFRVNEQAYMVINRIKTADNRESVCNILRCTRDIKVIGNIHDNQPTEV